MQPTTTNEFLDAVKTRLNLRSDYALIKALGVTQMSITRWRGGGAFNDANAIRVADLLDLPREYVLACMGAQRAEDTESSGVWRHIADAFAHRVALWLAVSLVGIQLLTPSPASAFSGFDLRNNVYYGKSRGRAKLRPA